MELVGKVTGRRSQKAKGKAARLRGGTRTKRGQAKKGDARTGQKGDARTVQKGDSRTVEENDAPKEDQQGHAVKRWGGWSLGVKGDQRRWTRPRSDST
jgi:uncharacterized protein YjbJ (UPF0337 family)